MRYITHFRDPNFLYYVLYGAFALEATPKDHPFDLVNDFPHTLLPHSRVHKQLRELCLRDDFLNPFVLSAEVDIELGFDLAHFQQSPLEESLAEELALVPPVDVVKEFVY